MRVKFGFELNWGMISQVYLLQQVKYKQIAVS